MCEYFKVQAAGSTAKAMGANVKMSQAMAETSKTMTNMNKLMNPAQVSKTMYRVTTKDRYNV